MRCAVVLATLLVASEVVAAPSPTDRCRTFMAANPDLVCLPLEAARATDLKLAQLDHDFTIARVASSHWGLGCTIGPYLGYALTQDLNAHVTGGPVGIGCGLNVRFGGVWWHRK